MPCNCDHLEPSKRERESRLLMSLLAEVGIGRGDIPYYGQLAAVDKHTAMLCKFCKENDVTKYSPVLQAWWVCHQAADKERGRRESPGGGEGGKP